MDQPGSGPGRPDRGPTIIAAAIIFGALILSWGLSSSQPRYELAGAGDMVVRMDTDSGAMIACDAQRCTRVQPPDRARTLGPLTVQVGNSERLPAPDTNRAP